MKKNAVCFVGQDFIKIQEEVKHMFVCVYARTRASALVCVCVCARACVCVCARARVYTCVCVCVWKKGG